MIISQSQMTLVIVQVLHQLYSVANGGGGAKKNSTKSHMNHFPLGRWFPFMGEVAKKGGLH